MGEYLRPDVYMEEVLSGARPIEGVSTSTAAFSGIAQRGVVGDATLVTSFADYINKFARGLKSPFYKNSYLAYAVYGFFNNGGLRAWINRVATDDAAKSAGLWKDAEAATVATITALDEGAWGDKLSVVIAANADTSSKWDVTVKLDSVTMEVFRKMSLDEDEEDFIEIVINGVSNFITIDVTGGTTPVAGTITLTDGDDGETGLADTDYQSGLTAFDSVEDINILAIPGLTTEVVVTAIIDYAENRKDCIAVIDVPMGKTPEEARTWILARGSSYAAFYYPWVYVGDPIGTGASKIKLIPPAGHVSGTYARTDQERGPWKVPAGIQAKLRGVVGVEYRVQNGDQDILNPVAVNCIRAMRGAGIVIWGGRTASPDALLKYVSDRRMLLFLENSIKRGSYWTVFEPNDAPMWRDNRNSIKSFLNTLPREALRGETPEDRYYVKCDADLNTIDMIKAGKCVTEIGVALQKPAEFMIFRISQWDGGSEVEEV